VQLERLEDCLRELIRQARLFDHAIDAGLARSLLVAGAAEPAETDHGGAAGAWIPAQPRHELEAVDSRHRQIGDDRVRLVPTCDGKAFVAVGRLQDFERSAQELNVHLACIGMILDDEDAGDTLGL
jgi:hypothetical protein